MMVLLGAGMWQRSCENILGVVGMPIFHSAVCFAGGQYGKKLEKDE